MSGEEERPSEEYQLLHFYGFHEVKDLEDVCQRGRAGVDVSVDPKMYSIDEALELIKAERGEQEGPA
jgi:hypothetical protein